MFLFLKIENGNRLVLKIEEVFYLRTTCLGVLFSSILAPTIIAHKHSYGIKLTYNCNFAISSLYK